MFSNFEWNDLVGVMSVFGAKFLFVCVEKILPANPPAYINLLRLLFVKSVNLDTKTLKERSHVANGLTSRQILLWELNQRRLIQNDRKVLRWTFRQT